jgi:ABC-type phosphate transport system substrate-binding protein
MQFNVFKQTAACLTLVLFAGACAHAEAVVVVSSRSAVGSLSSNQVAQIFLGKSVSFPNGEAAVALDVSEAGLKSEFYRKVTGKDASQLKSYWAQLIFTGQARPPRSVSDSAEARRIIASNPGMIGYISRDAVDSSVKVVLSP